MGRDRVRVGRIGGRIGVRVVGLRVGLGWMGLGRVEGQGLGVDGVKAIGRDRAGSGTGGLR